MSEERIPGTRVRRPSQPRWEYTSRSEAPDRSLTRVLLGLTLSLAFVLGVLAAVFQLGLDLRQQMDAVEISAGEFLDSVLPSAESAAYNYQNEAAAEVARGLFSQRAISRVRIENEGEVMIDEERDLAPTLPRFVQFAKQDDVVLTRPLRTPGSEDPSKQIGSITITVDRSIVSPSIVDRMMSYFALALIKNFAFGILLLLLVYSSLARYLVRLIDSISAWTPERSRLVTPTAPRLFSGTELEFLGRRIENLADGAREVIRLKSRRELELSRKSDELREMVRARTSELEDANAKLRELADRDALTALYNRGALDREMSRRFEEAALRGQPVGVLLADIDSFKAYNDFYGHQAGDSVISQVGRCIGSVAESVGGVAGRYGGEEFALLRVGASDTEMVQLGQKIHENIAQLAIPHGCSPCASYVTVSIGLSTTDQGSGSLDALIGQADRALYDAKEKGRNQSCTFKDVPDRRAAMGDRSQRAIREAILQEDFEPYFQPQFDASNGNVVGLEVLSRLRLGDGTILAPDSFFPTVGKLSSLHAMDAVILKKLRNTLVRAQENKIVIPRVSLNASLATLKMDDFCAAVAELSDMGDTQVSIELLETHNMDRIDSRTTWQIDRLREVGVEFEIDDFGTGQASILALHAVRPERLKIAREVVFPLVVRDDFLGSVKSILALARELQIGVIAEGVETATHREKLIALGCIYHQGYFYARPMPEEDTFALLQGSVGVEPLSI